MKGRPPRISHPVLPTPPMIIRARSPLACFALCVGTTLGTELVGQRPYEMVWANRTTDTTAGTGGFREPRRVDRRVRRCRGFVPTVAATAVVGAIRRRARLPRHGQAADDRHQAAEADSRLRALQLREPLGLRQQLVLWPRPENPAGGNRRAAPRTRRQRSCGSFWVGSAGRSGGSCTAV